MPSDDADSKPAEVRNLRCDAYPGYEWVALVGGSDWDTRDYILRLLEDAGLDARQPGSSIWAGILARIEHAPKARRLLAANLTLKHRYAFLEDESGTHPFSQLPGDA